MKDQRRSRIFHLQKMVILKGPNDCVAHVGREDVCSESSFIKGLLQNDNKYEIPAPIQLIKWSKFSFDSFTSYVAKERIVPPADDEIHLYGDALKMADFLVADGYLKEIHSMILNHLRIKAGFLEDAPDRLRCYMKCFRKIFSLPNEADKETQRKILKATDMKSAATLITSGYPIFYEGSSSIHAFVSLPIPPDMFYALSFCSRHAYYNVQNSEQYLFWSTETPFQKLSDFPPLVRNWLSDHRDPFLEDMASFLPPCFPSMTVLPAWHIYDSGLACVIRRVFDAAYEHLEGTERWEVVSLFLKHFRLKMDEPTHFLECLEATGDAQLGDLFLDNLDMKNGILFHDHTKNRWINIIIEAARKGRTRLFTWMLRQEKAAKSRLYKHLMTCYRLACTYDRPIIAVALTTHNPGMMPALVGMRAAARSQAVTTFMMLSHFAQESPRLLSTKDCGPLYRHLLRSKNRKGLIEFRSIVSVKAIKKLNSEIAHECKELREALD